MSPQSRTIQTFLMLFTLAIFAIVVAVDERSAIADNNLLLPVDTLSDCVRILENTDSWDVFSGTKFRINENDPIRKSVELLGAIRNMEHMSLLTSRIGTVTRSVGGLPRGFDDAFVAAALVRVGSPAIEPVLIEYQNPSELFPSGLFMGMYTSFFFRGLLPIDSSLAIIENHIEYSSPKLLDKQREKFVRLIETLDSYRRHRNTEIELPPLSDFVLNHPLYKQRQSEIESNLAILNARKKIVTLDAKTLSAVSKLGELRAVEAVETFVPLLLVKPDTGVKPNEGKENAARYDSIKEYPVALALAEVGIPSIWGMLDEVAAHSHNADNYREVAHKTMTTILPAVAIPGFVNESLKKHSDEIAQLRLYKMYPLLGLSIESTPLIPQLRSWESTDGLFKASAKYVSSGGKDVTLEKPDGKQTTIELSALRKADQDYVREQLETAKP